MAGTIKANAVQLGDSATATNNFVLQTNTDGSAKLARGNLGATTQDIISVDAAGKTVTPVMPFVGTAPIVESGSNANGSWIKWADGTMICDIRISHTAVPISAATGPLFYHASGFTYTYPAAFISLPTATINIIGSGGLSWATLANVMLSQASFFIMAPTNRTETSIGHLVVIGRWK